MIDDGVFTLKGFITRTATTSASDTTPASVPNIHLRREPKAQRRASLTMLRGPRIAIHPRQNRLATAAKQEVLPTFLRGKLFHTVTRTRESLNGLNPQAVFFGRSRKNVESSFVHRIHLCRS